jgi:hypothetical protein
MTYVKKNRDLHTGIRTQWPYRTFSAPTQLIVLNMLLKTAGYTLMNSVTAVSTKQFFALLGDVAK